MVCETHLHFIDPSESWQCFVRQDDWVHYLLKFYEARVVLRSGAWSVEFCDRALGFGADAIALERAARDALGEVGNIHTDGSFVVLARDTNVAFRIRMERHDLRELAEKVGEQLKRGPPKKLPIILNRVESVPALWHITVTEVPFYR